MRYRKLLSHSLVATILLGGAGVVGAAARPAPDPVQFEAHLGLIKAKRELRDILRNGHAAHPMLGELHQHHQTAGKRGENLRLFGSGEHVVELDGEGKFVTSTGGQKRPSELSDLEHHKVTDQKAFERSIAKRLLETAGMTGDHENEPMRLQATKLLATNRATALDLATYTAHRSPDAALLLRHQQAVEQQMGIKAENEVALLGGELTLNQQGLFQRGTAERARLYDLNSHGIETLAKLDAQIAREMVRIAGVKGEATDPKVVAEARSVLNQQIAHVALLNQLILAPGRQQGTNQVLHPRLELLVDTQTAIATRNGTPLHVTLAKEGNTTIEIAHLDLPAQYGTQYNPGSRRHINVVTQNAFSGTAIVVATEGEAPRLAKLTDLQKLGMGTMAGFDAAISNAIMDIAPEDL